MTMNDEHRTLVTEDKTDRVDESLHREMTHHRYNKQQGIGLIQQIEKDDSERFCITIELPFGEEQFTETMADRKEFDRLLAATDTTVYEFDQMLDSEVPVQYDKDEGWQLDEGRLPELEADSDHDIERDEYLWTVSIMHIIAFLLITFISAFAGKAMDYGHGGVALALIALAGIVFGLFFLQSYQRIKKLKRAAYDWTVGE